MQPNAVLSLSDSCLLGFIRGFFLDFSARDGGGVRTADAARVRMSANIHYCTDVEAECQTAQVSRFKPQCSTRKVEIAIAAHSPDDRSCRAPFPNSKPHLADHTPKESGRGIPRALVVSLAPRRQAFLSKNPHPNQASPRTRLVPFHAARLSGPSRVP